MQATRHSVNKESTFVLVISNSVIMVGAVSGLHVSMSQQAAMGVRRRLHSGASPHCLTRHGTLSSQDLQMTNHRGSGLRVVVTQHTKRMAIGSSTCSGERFSQATNRTRSFAIPKCRPNFTLRGYVWSSLFGICNEVNPSGSRAGAVSPTMDWNQGWEEECSVPESPQ